MRIIWSRRIVLRKRQISNEYGWVAWSLPRYVYGWVGYTRTVVMYNYCTTIVLLSMPEYIMKTTKDIIRFVSKVRW